MGYDIGDLVASLKIGDVDGGNYTAFETDGTMERNGAATCWEDMVTSLAGKKIESSSGKVDYDWENNALVFQSGGSISTRNDRIIWNYQKLHGIKAVSDMMMHIHFVQPNSNKFEFTMQYRVQKNNAVTATTWTTLTVNTDDDAVFTYPGSGDFNQIVGFAAIDMTGTNLSDIYEFRLARTDSVTGDLLVKYVDAHVEFDTDGSRTEWSK